MASTVLSKLRQGWVTFGKKVVAPKFNLLTILPVYEAGDKFSDMKMQYLKLQAPLSNIHCEAAIVQQICFQLEENKVVSTFEIRKYLNDTENNDLGSLVSMFTRKEPGEICKLLEILRGIKGFPETSSRFQEVIGEIVPKTYVEVTRQIKEAGSNELSPDDKTESGESQEDLGDKISALGNIGNKTTHRSEQLFNEDMHKIYKKPLLQVNADMYKSIRTNTKSSFEVTWKKLSIFVAVGVGVLGIGSLLYTLFTELTFPSKIINTTMAPITYVDQLNTRTNSSEITVIETIVNASFHKYHFLK